MVDGHGNGDVYGIVVSRGHQGPWHQVLHHPSNGSLYRTATEHEEAGVTTKHQIVFGQEQPGIP